MTNDKHRPRSARSEYRSGGSASAERWDGETADASDEPLQDALVEESDRLMSAVDEIKRLESEKRRLAMSTPEFHQAASRIERMARQVFGIAKAQREVGEALQSQHDESIEDEARDRDPDPDRNADRDRDGDRDGAERTSAAPGSERRR